MRTHPLVRILSRTFALTVLLLAACAPYIRHETAGRRAFGRGDYDGATFEACASLRYKPDYVKARFLLSDAFRAASNWHLGRIGELRLSSARFRWDEIAQHYDALVKLNRAASELPAMAYRPGLPEPPQTGDYSAQLTEANANAAEAHYQEGVRLAASSSELSAQQQAYAEFGLAERYVPGYRDAASRAGAAKRAGMRRVAVLPFEDVSSLKQQYGALMLQATDRVAADIAADASVTDFVEMVSRDQLEQVMAEQQLEASGTVDPTTAVRLGRLLGCHDILTGRVTQILVTPASTRRTTSEHEVEVVDHLETYKDSLGNEQQREVKVRVRATLNTFTKTASARVAGSYSVINVGTAAVGTTGALEGGRDWSEQWGTYEGDKRALTQEQLVLCGKDEPQALANVSLVTDAAMDFAARVGAAARNYLR